MYAIKGPDGRYVSQRTPSPTSCQVYFTDKPHMVLSFDRRGEAIGWLNWLITEVQTAHRRSLFSKKGYGNYVNEKAKDEGTARVEFVRSLKIGRM